MGSASAAWRCINVTAGNTMGQLSDWARIVSSAGGRGGTYIQPGNCPSADGHKSQHNDDVWELMQLWQAHRISSLSITATFWGKLFDSQLKREPKLFSFVEVQINRLRNSLSNARVVANNNNNYSGETINPTTVYPPLLPFSPFLKHTSCRLNGHIKRLEAQARFMDKRALLNEGRQRPIYNLAQYFCVLVCV